MLELTLDEYAVKMRIENLGRRSARCLKIVAGRMWFTTRDGWCIGSRECISTWLPTQCIEHERYTEDMIRQQSRGEVRY